MKIETLEFAGLRSALHGMRNPMDSWEKSDNAWAVCNLRSIGDDGVHVFGIDVVQDYHIGNADKDLSMRLQKAGPEHCKHLRQIMVWADITAPRYWWTEFDTYRVGVEKVSCSTMHKLMARKLATEDFEIDDPDSFGFQTIVQYIDDLMDEYRDTESPEEKKAIWRHIIQCLPQNYLQKRTVMMSYAALRNVYHQREGHKLREWQIFREWVESLPESWMIT